MTDTPAAPLDEKTIRHRMGWLKQMAEGIAPIWPDTLQQIEEITRIAVSAVSDSAAPNDLRSVLETVISEVSWFVSRKKDLSAPTDKPGQIWADVLNGDLDIGRRALKTAAPQVPPSGSAGEIAGADAASAAGPAESAARCVSVAPVARVLEEAYRKNCRTCNGDAWTCRNVGLEMDEPCVAYNVRKALAAPVSSSPNRGKR